MRRLLGIDLGERRIGLAIADDDGSGARPLATIRRARDPQADADAIGAIVATNDIAELVVGLPLNASGTRGSPGEPDPRVGRSRRIDVSGCR